MSRISCILVISFLMTKVETPSLLDSAPAAFPGKPSTSIPVVRSAEAIAVHPILFARGMASPGIGPDDEPSETHPIADAAFRRPPERRPNDVCVWVGPVREGRSGRLVWRAKLPYLRQQ